MIGWQKFKRHSSHFGSFDLISNGRDQTDQTKQRYIFYVHINKMGIGHTKCRQGRIKKAIKVAGPKVLTKQQNMLLALMISVEQSSAGKVEL